MESIFGSGMYENHLDGAYWRGQSIRQQLLELPSHIRQSIESYVKRLCIGQRSVVTLPQPRSLIQDVMGLLAVPCIRMFVLSDSQSNARWAAITGVFVHTISHDLPALLAEQVYSLLPSIAGIIKPILGLFRMGLRNDFRLAIEDASQGDLRLSMLGPLAIFFLNSLARAELAWEYIVEEANRPKQPKAFGWAPSIEPLNSALRRALLGDAHHRPKPKALLYSALARYLIELGLIHRVTVVQSPAWSSQPTGDANDSPGHNSLWALSGEYISSCQSRMGKCVILLEHLKGASQPKIEELVVDYRTNRRATDPPEELESAEAMSQLASAVRRLICRYLNPSRSQWKRLVLWAHAARIDPLALLSSETPDERRTASLLDVLLSPSVRHCSVLELNNSLATLPPETGAGTASVFTDQQVRTYLSRLRQDFKDMFDAGDL
jgi:hypothetical protein